MEELRRRQTNPNDDDVSVAVADEKDELGVIQALLKKYITKKMKNKHFQRRFTMYFILCIGLTLYLSFRLYKHLQCGDSHMVEAYTRYDNEPRYFSGSHDDVMTAHETLNYHRLDKRRSDLLPLNRELSDYRPEVCKVKLYPDTDLRLSVIVVVESAPASVILRLVTSIINRTRPKNLAEIILYLQREDRELMQHLKENKVYILRTITTSQRKTLNKARNEAAKQAVGNVLVFIPEAAEMLQGWAEPLLEVMANNTNTLAGLSMDEIHHKTFRQIEHVPWHLITYPRWDLISAVPIEIPEHERKRRSLFPYPDATPIKTPAIIFPPWAIGKKFFLEIGGLDETLQEHVELVPGDTLELSIRAWCCHGNVVYVPCSKVAIISLMQHAGYSEDKQKQVELHNSKVIADRWAGHYINFYHAKQPKALQIITVSNTYIDDIIHSSSLQCQDLTWYLNNIAVDWKMGDSYAMQGSIKLATQDRCIDTMGHEGRYTPGRPEFYGCHGGFTQFWLLEKESKHIITETGKCLRSDAFEHDVITLDYCDKTGNEWIFEDLGNHIGYLKHKGLCLESRQVNNLIYLAPCRDTAEQQFKFQLLGN